ncbi:MAG: GGDEF domain-containing protein [Motiliproteus sp.]|nr:GGDEF domain-containing protein [Motiliproteus sp.]MCW9051492.1 GGDEF domain-containing protein [Motiliproteus sp.]
MVTDSKLLSLQHKLKEQEQTIAGLRDRLSAIEPLYHDYMALLAHTPDFIYIKNHKHQFTSTSDAFARLTGHDCWQQLVGKTDFDIFPAEHAHRYFNCEKAVIDAGEHLEDLEEPYYGDDGELRWVSSYKRPIHDDTGRICGLVGISRDITHRKRHEHQIQHLATHDQLTGLANRHMLEEVGVELMALSRRLKHQFCLFFIDLDNLKQTNDYYGHDIGDEVLVTVSRRLEKTFRMTDVICRFGGDEFIVLTISKDPEWDVRRFGESALMQLAKPLPVGQDWVPISCSIGVAVATELDSNIEDLIQRADRVMYRAKAKGKGRVEVE